MKIILIAATTLDGKISKATNEYVDWSLDLSLFKKQTLNHTIIIGSKTLTTLRKPLLDRQVVVLDRNMNLEHVLAKISTPKCFIVGGTKTYSLFLKYITHLYLTPHPLFFGLKSKPLFENVHFNRKIAFDKKILAHKQKKIYQLQYKVYD